jgi:tRNA nucleotidyltransferase (CCA-adding enzyme)
MLKEIAKIKERTIIDPEKLFKKKTDVIFEMNESKLNSPIILVDPTWKERNALAALNWESFRKFQEAATKFLKKPSTSFFEIKEVDKKEIMEEARARKAEFADIWIETDRQPGDIAGTKLKKFGDFAMREMSKYFEIARKEFDYSGGKAADIYIIAKPKKELIKSGPPAKMDMHAKAFRKENKNVFEKSGILHARVRIDFSAKEFLIKFKKDYAKTIREMGITKLEIKN